MPEMTDEDMRAYAARHGLTTLAPEHLARMRELAARKPASAFRACRTNRTSRHPCSGCPWRHGPTAPSLRPSKNTVCPMRATPPAAPDTGAAARPLYTQVAEALTADITTGRRGVGTLLPTEHELCALHGVSRATVREALRKLEAQGADRPQPGRRHAGADQQRPHPATSCPPNPPSRRWDMLPRPAS
ncbi:MAG: winged helix-turn-helix domain-containing protein [Acetobacteraceae bacterium]